MVAQDFSGFHAASSDIAAARNTADMGTFYHHCNYSAIVTPRPFRTSAPCGPKVRPQSPSRPRLLFDHWAVGPSALPCAAPTTRPAAGALSSLLGGCVNHRRNQIASWWYGMVMTRVGPTADGISGESRVTAFPLIQTNSHPPQTISKGSEHDSLHRADMPSQIHWIWLSVTHFLVA